jgi:hypothetical protein
MVSALVSWFQNSYLPSALADKSERPTDTHIELIGSESRIRVHPNPHSPWLLPVTGKRVPSQ